jgi:uncharacterized protein YutE (UPF0331/DUF86 family)
MTQLDKETILNKLALMIEHIEALKNLETLSLETFLEDSLSRYAIERLLELTIQSALDINKTLLKRVAGIKPPDSKDSFANFDSFILVGEQGFLPLQLATDLAPSGSFRNVLAHQYDDIDSSQVYAAFQKALIQYPQYIRAICTFIDTLED